VSLKATTKYGEKRIKRRDMLRQTVPYVRDAATGNDRSPTVDRRVRRTTNDDDDDDADRSLHRSCRSADRLSSSARYGGAVPCILYTRTASLKSIRSFA